MNNSTAIDSIAREPSSHMIKSFLQHPNSLSDAVLQDKGSLPQPQFSNEDLTTLKDTYCQGLNKSQFNLFIRTAQNLELNPFNNEICAVLRYNRKANKYDMTIQTQIGGHRKIAVRTGKFRGSKIDWCNNEGVWCDIWLHDSPPAGARCTVWVDGYIHPMVRVVTWKDSVQKYEGKPQSMWAKMPAIMLGKCAEAACLRASFIDLSGMYINDEMPIVEADTQNVLTDEQPIQTVESIVKEIASEPKPGFDTQKYDDINHDLDVRAQALGEKFYDGEWVEYLKNYQACRKNKNVKCADDWIAYITDVIKRAEYQLVHPDRANPTESDIKNIQDEIKKLIVDNNISLERVTLQCADLYDKVATCIKADDLFMAQTHLITIRKEIEKMPSEKGGSK